MSQAHQLTEKPFPTEQVSKCPVISSSLKEFQNLVKEIKNSDDIAMTVVNCFTNIILSLRKIFSSESFFLGLTRRATKINKVNIVAKSHIPKNIER